MVVAVVSRRPLNSPYVGSFPESGSGCHPSASLVELGGIFRGLGVCPGIGQYVLCVILAACMRVRTWDNL